MQCCYFFFLFKDEFLLHGFVSALARNYWGFLMAFFYFPVFGIGGLIIFFGKIEMIETLGFLKYKLFSFNV